MASACRGNLGLSIDVSMCGALLVATPCVAAVRAEYIWRGRQKSPTCWDQNAEIHKQSSKLRWSGILGVGAG